jgi:hypothetical protein
MKIYSLFIVVISIIIILGCAFYKSLKEGLTNKYNIVLIGDSILNNSKYVPSQKSVYDILQTKSSNVFLFAKDGSTIIDCYVQLDQVPIELNTPDTYVFISVGGNNLLSSSQLNSSNINDLFKKYMKFIESVKAKLPNANIIILNLYLPTNTKYTTYKTSVDEWNSLITKNANNNHIIYNVIDLHGLLTNPSDFVYDIEPSEQASQTIANAIYLTR